MSATLFCGIVKQVLAGDTIVIRDRPIDGPPPERTIVLSNVSCGRPARRPTPATPAATLDEPFAWHAREFSRVKLIGKEVCYTVETELPSGRKYGNIFLGKSTNGENIALSLVEEGYAEVRKLNAPAAEKNQIYQQLLSAQEIAKSSGKGRWSSTTVDSVRNIVWTIEDPKGFFESYKKQQLKAIVENVRDGSTLQLLILPDSLHDHPNNFVYVTFVLSGIKAPPVKYDDGKMVYEGLGPDAQFFVESRLLQREVSIFLESFMNQNFVGTVVHPNGNIAEHLLRQGLARCVDWNLNLVSVPGGADAYRCAERYAKEKRLRLWKDYQIAPADLQASVDPNKVLPGASFPGIICEVGNGDNVTLKCSNGVTRKIFLSSIRAPKLPMKDQEDNATQRVRGRPLYDIPYLFEARESLRNYVGKTATAHVDYIQPKTATTTDERVCATIQVEDGTNLALSLVSNGLASVIRYRNANDARTSAYTELIAAEEDAQAKGLGIFSKQDPPIHRVADLTGNVAKSRQFLTFLQRAERLDGVVEFVSHASRLRVYVPRETCVITLLLSGVQCPRKGRVGPDGLVEPDTPFSNEALSFVKDVCMQRNVELKIETIDRVGNFVGWLFMESSSPSSNSMTGILEPVKQGGKKKKKTTDLSTGGTMKQKVNLSVLLVSLGFATVHRAPTTERSPYFNDLIKAEDEAKSTRRGLWSSNEFVKQWEAEINATLDMNNGDSVDEVVLLSGVKGDNPEYLDDLSGLKLNAESNDVQQSCNEALIKLNPKAAQVTGISLNATGSQGLRFFAQYLSDANTIIQISHALNSQTLPSLPPTFHPKKGSILAACFSLDNCWYRARILRSSEKGVRVQFIDFGNEETIDVTEFTSRLSPLPPQLLPLPPQATEYRLAFVQLPPDPTDRLIAENAFCGHVENKEIRLAIQFEAVPCGNETVKPVPAVSVLLPIPSNASSVSGTNSSDLDVGVQLLADGLVCVEPIKPQLLKRLPHNLLQQYLDAQANAKKERKNIWRYGDFRMDAA